MSKAIISVDTGKGYTKWARLNDDESDFVKDEMYTRYTVADGISDVLIGRESNKVKYQGKEYTVGLQGVVTATDTRDKKLELHKLATYTSITKLLREGENEVAVIINMPCTSYESKEIRNEMIDFYKNDGEDIDIEVNGNKFSFKITDVVPAPEGAGFLFRYTELCNGNTTVINIGKLNINAISMINQDITKMLCLEYGGTKLENNVKLSIEKVLGSEITEDVNTLFEILKKGYYEQFGKEVDKTRESVEIVRKEFIDSIVAQLKNKGMDISTSNNIYFTGGTSLALADEIKRHPQLSAVSQVLEDAKWVDVEGNLIYGINKIMSMEDVDSND